MTNKEIEEQFEIVWSGGEGLIPDRPSKNLGESHEPTRIYNKTGKHSKTRAKDQPDPETELIDILSEDE